MRLLKFHLLVGVGLVFGCLFVIAGCEAKSSVKGPDLSPDIAGAAHKTHIQYVRAVNAGTEKVTENIPEQYWGDGIKALKPIKVYLHRVNIVAVQSLSSETEQGKYICIPVSSYIPQSGDDGFTFTEQKDDVYDYKRSIVN